MKFASKHFASSLALAACIATSPAVAQDAGANEGSQGAATNAHSDIDAIVVTARRTSESLEKVPVAVTALSARDLTEQRVVNENDLQTVAAGLTARTTNSSEQIAFALRGQTLDAFSYSAPSVLTYFNETQITGVASSAFYDLQSIQVVKGPGARKPR